MCYYFYLGFGKMTHHHCIHPLIMGSKLIKFIETNLSSFLWYIIGKMSKMKFIVSNLASNIGNK